MLDFTMTIDAVFRIAFACVCYVIVFICNGDLNFEID